MWPVYIAIGAYLVAEGIRRGIHYVDEHRALPPRRSNCNYLLEAPDYEEYDDYYDDDYDDDDDYEDDD